MSPQLPRASHRVLVCSVAPLVATAHAATVLRSSQLPQTLRNGVRSFTPGHQRNSFSREAVEMVRAQMDMDLAIETMKKMNIDAHRNDEDAQYNLGMSLLREEDDHDDDSELLLDAKAKRHFAPHQGEEQDKKVISKYARYAYKKVLLDKRAEGEGEDDSQRETKSDSDRAVGVTLTQLLDPQTELRPLSSVAQEEREYAQLSDDSAHGVEWLRRAAANGHRDAHAKLGKICMEQNPPLAHHALEWFSRVSPPKMESNPHPDATYFMGQFLYLGLDEAEPPFPANPQGGLSYITRAAEAGFAPAQFGMCLLYRSGDERCGVKLDREKFLEYLDKAVEGGDGDALFCKAELYIFGLDGFEKDVKQGKRLYQAAGEAGNADAYDCLGRMHYNGTGVEQDYEKAFAYFQCAADLDSTEAWEIVAGMYFEGLGVPKNEAEAESIVMMLEKKAAE